MEKGSDIFQGVEGHINSSNIMINSTNVVR